MSVLVLKPTGIFPADHDTLQTALNDTSITKILLKSVNEQDVPTEWNLGGNDVACPWEPDKNARLISPFFNAHVAGEHGLNYQLAITRDVEIVGDVNQNGTPKTILNGGIWHIGLTAGGCIFPFTSDFLFNGIWQIPLPAGYPTGGTMATLADVAPKVKIMNLSLKNIPGKAFVGVKFDSFKLKNVHMKDIYPSAFVMPEFNYGEFLETWDANNMFMGIFPLVDYEFSNYSQYAAVTNDPNHPDLTAGKGVFYKPSMGALEINLIDCVFDHRLPLVANGAPADRLPSQVTSEYVSYVDESTKLRYRDQSYQLGSLIVGHNGFNGSIKGCTFYGAPGSWCILELDDTDVPLENSTDGKRFVIADNTIHTSPVNPAYEQIFENSATGEIVGYGQSGTNGVSGILALQRQFFWVNERYPYEILRNTINLNASGDIGIQTSKFKDCSVRHNKINIAAGVTAQTAIFSTYWAMKDFSGQWPFVSAWPEELRNIGNNAFRQNDIVGHGDSHVHTVYKEYNWDKMDGLVAYNVNEELYVRNSLISCTTDYADYEFSVGIDNSKAFVEWQQVTPIIIDNGSNNTFVGPGARQAGYGNPIHPRPYREHKERCNKRLKKPGWNP